MSGVATMILGVRLALLLGGDGSASGSQAFSRSLGDAPTQERPGEGPAVLPILKEEAGEEVGVDAAPGPFPSSAGRGTDSRPGLLAGSLWTSLPVVPQEKSTGQDRSGERGPFDPPHGSWAGLGNHFSGEAWKESVWEDYLTTPEILLPLGLGVSAAAISHWDKPLAKHWHGLLGNHRSYSDIGQYGLIGAVVLDGILLPGEGRNGWDQAWTIGEAYGVSSLMVYLLKTSVGRIRPGGMGTQSFPSGHATSSFTAATLIERNSGPLLGVPAYGVAAFTAFERVEEGHHFPSDVLAGAAIGTFFASVFDSLHWGSGPGDGGIARPAPEAKVGFLDGLHGFTAELSFRF